MQSLPLPTASPVLARFKTNQMPDLNRPKRLRSGHTTRGLGMRAVNGSGHQIKCASAWVAFMALRNWLTRSDAFEQQVLGWSPLKGGLSYPIVAHTEKIRRSASLNCRRALGPLRRQ